jgi:hypothetical protein
MKKKTELQYQKMAKGFYAKYFPKGGANEEKIIATLKHISHEFQPKSFANLKCALAFDIAERGHMEIAQAVRELENPAANFRSYPQKNKKVKCLSTKDMKKLQSAVKGKKGDVKLINAVAILTVFGMRPAELKTTQRINEVTFYIKSVKKDEFGLKGLDRILKVDSIVTANAIEYALKSLDNEKITKLQDRFAYLMKKTFPKRTSRPTLYIFRHQMGSNLKKSDYSRHEMAYIMGHQSTRTIENYGYKQSGNGNNIKISSEIDLAEIKRLVRDGHSVRDSKRKERIKNVASKNNNKKPR